MNPMDRRFVMEKYGRLKDMDRSFDIAYWQRLGPEAIFEAAWQMVVDAEKLRGLNPDELRLRKDVERYSRRATSERKLLTTTKKLGEAPGKPEHVLGVAFPHDQNPPAKAG